MPYERLQESNVSEYTTVAQAAGFEILNLVHVYDTEDPYELTLPWDNHPNTRGHRLIADYLYSVLSGERDRVSRTLIDPRTGRL
jgi:hypothetical protein